MEVIFYGFYSLVKEQDKKIRERIYNKQGMEIGREINKIKNKEAVQNYILETKEFGQLQKELKSEKKMFKIKVKFP